MTDKERLAFLAEYLEKLSLMIKSNKNLEFIEGCIKELLRVAKSSVTPGLGLKRINGDYYDDKTYNEFIEALAEERIDKIIKEEIKNS